MCSPANNSVPTSASACFCPPRRYPGPIPRPALSYGDHYTYVASQGLSWSPSAFTDGGCWGGCGWQEEREKGLREGERKGGGRERTLGGEIKRNGEVDDGIVESTFDLLPTVTEKYTAKTTSVETLPKKRQWQKTNTNISQPRANGSIADPVFYVV